MIRGAPAQFLEILGEDGCRHVVRVGSIQLLSDVDIMRDTTALVVAGRQIVVPTSLDEILDRVFNVSRRSS